MERDASTETMSEDTPSSRKEWCCMLFDSFAGSRLADLETPEGGTRSESHGACLIADAYTHGSSESRGTVALRFAASETTRSCRDFLLIARFWHNGAAQE